MAHVPHLYLPGPWTQSHLSPSDEQSRHVQKVLRLREASSVSYTDGLGTAGVGTWIGGSVARGDEHSTERVRELRVAVAPPKAKERQRFLVEKLSELGVTQLIWLRTTFTEGRPAAKAESWAIAALEQSRGAFLMSISGPEPYEHVEGWLADPAGERLVERAPFTEKSITLLIGPEGGFSEDEMAQAKQTFSLGTTILRTETAAIVAAGICLT